MDRKLSQLLKPVAKAHRIASLDVIRGFALLGILTMNVGAFSMPASAYFAPTVYGDLTGFNGFLWQITHVLADLKFMAIFSMLFGAGIVLMAEKCEATNRSPVGLHYRRMFWLIVFGLLHAYLLWWGDILFWYGTCGLVVFLFRKLPPHWLILLGVGSLAMTSGLMFAIGCTTENWPPKMTEFVCNDLKPPTEAIEAEVLTYQGSWLKQMEKRVPKSFEMQTSTFLVWACWRVSGLMFLGMALFKYGVFSARCSRGVYWSFIALAVTVGIPLTIFGIQHNFSTNWQAPEFFFFGTQFNYWASLFVSLGWVGTIMLVCKSNISAQMTRPLAAVGQTALSNYILQSVICTTIFYGHGFALFGQVERTSQLFIVLAIWVFQLVTTRLWLSRFQFGPLEWLWRSLVYWKRQPFLRT